MFIIFLVAHELTDSHFGKSLAISESLHTNLPQFIGEAMLGVWSNETGQGLGLVTLTLAFIVIGAFQLAILGVVLVGFGYAAPCPVS